MPTTGTLIGYARVSTKDQSTKHQVEALRKHGVELDNIFVETVSGISHRRPRLEEAMAKCDAGDTFVVWKFDRFGRSIIDLLKRMKMLEDKGVGFVSLTDQIDTSTPAGRLMVHMLAAIAQFERDMISERTRAGMQHKILTTGYRPGPTPKLDGAPRERAQELRNEWRSVPEIATAIKDEFDIDVSWKTLYNQTVSPIKPKRKR